MSQLLNPFGLSLSKPLTCLEEEKPFDRLRANGFYPDKGSEEAEKE